MSNVAAYFTKETLKDGSPVTVRAIALTTRNASLKPFCISSPRQFACASFTKKEPEHSEAFARSGARRRYPVG